MRAISANEKSIALDILKSSFKNNPGVLYVVKNDHKRPERIAELCRFCLSVSIEKGGAFITSNNIGVALIIKSWKKQNPFNFLYRYFRLGQYCIGWDRALQIIRRDKMFQDIRPKNKHLYFWMLGVKDQSSGLETIKEIRDFAFQYSYDLKLPIYAETTLKSTLELYIRYGFEVYHKMENDEEDITTYFIRRDWDKNFKS